MPKVSKKVFVSKKLTPAKKATKTTAKVVKKSTAKKVVAKKTPVKKVAAKKVTVKKAPAKKTTTKKVTAKKKATKATKKVAKDLVYSNNEQSFWLSDGQVLNSLLALHEALLLMSDDIFYHHVNDDKNDFAEWVDYVLCDGDCAIELRKADSKDKVVKVVKKYLKTYKI